MDRLKLPQSSSTSASPETRHKYQRIRDHLYSQIHSGHLAPGQSLPTEAKLVESLGISRHTVRQALAELENDGVIHRVQGRGTFVTTQQQRQARQQLDVFAVIAPQFHEGLYPSLVQGFEQSGATYHHQILVGSSGNDTSKQGDLILQMIDRSVGGVALVPATTAPTPAYQIRQLQQNYIPVVFCHRTVDGASAPLITWTGTEVGRQAGIILAEKDHRHVAFLFDYRTKLADEYHQGLSSALADAHLVDGKVSVVMYGASNADIPASKAIQQALSQLLARSDRPTAVFCGNIPDAEQVYLHAESLGFKVPRDLSLIAFSDVKRGRGLAERISCVAVDEVAIGARAAEVLHEMRSGQRALDSDERIDFPVTRLPGDTIALANGPVHAKP